MSSRRDRENICCRMKKTHRKRIIWQPKCCRTLWMFSARPSVQIADIRLKWSIQTEVCNAILKDHYIKLYSKNKTEVRTTNDWCGVCEWWVCDCNFACLLRTCLRGRYGVTCPKQLAMCVKVNGRYTNIRKANIVEHRMTKKKNHIYTYICWMYSISYFSHLYSLFLFVMVMHIMLTRVAYLDSTFSSFSNKPSTFHV